MNKLYNRGFTLIELLVVIAIIGILAAVVLASLIVVVARSRGEDTAIKQQLSSIRAEAELSYDSNDRSYSLTCSDISPLYDELPGDDDLDKFCNQGTDGYAVNARLSTGEWFCIDYTGLAITTVDNTIELSPVDFSCN